mgnify:CR=1 FL=1
MPETTSPSVMNAIRGSDNSTGRSNRSIAGPSIWATHTELGLSRMRRAEFVTNAVTTASGEISKASTLATSRPAGEVQTIVAGYEQKIAEARALLDRKLQEQSAVQTSCNSRKLEVQKVLEFFGQEEVARVVQSSPKLIEPVPASERKG